MPVLLALLCIGALVWANTEAMTRQQQMAYEMSNRHIGYIEVITVEEAQK